MKGFMILVAAWALLMFHSAFNAQAQTGTYAGKEGRTYIYEQEVGAGVKATWGQLNGERFDCTTVTYGDGTSYTSCN